ncbi:transposase IS66 family protein [Geobacillus kaustophilus]|uniref:Transposase IS66 family protein n=1 Tax=Geobacillus kaustophilus TaxID=1462 RepID=A0A0D8BUH9_GEOKU|nr:transposase IS66 family protein [Geobacillus kaustophilus]
MVEAAIKEIDAALLASKTLHVDETRLRVDGKNQWVHVASTAKVTRYGLHRSRGKQATDDIGILPRYKGTMVHDAYVKADYFFPKIAGLKFPRRTSWILLFFLLEPFFP